MTELAARFAVEGNVPAGQNARTMLIGGTYNALNQLTPTGATPYILATYPCAIAATYDLIHPLLSIAERGQVIGALEQWIQALLAARGSFPFALYGSATNNFSFAWSTGVAFSLLAIWGESGRPNIPQEIAIYANKIREGLRDVVSVDGSVDEAYGYANYGIYYSLHALLAAERSGFGDLIAGTNILRTPRWITASLMGESFPWIGDSGPTHRGMRVDPILYAIIGREQDRVGLFGMQRAQISAPLDVNQSTFAWSPFLTTALHYPEGLSAAAPVRMSAFFRDNLNLAPSGNALWNITNNNSAIGLGGTAFLHNLNNLSAPAFGAYYLIRDEWMSHAHEDDGHVGIVAAGKHVFLDRGYASNPGFVNAQHDEHNIVTAVGASAYHVQNHFTPPPGGRYLGERKAMLLSSSLDYVRGDHKTLWMMQRADRTVMLVKDAVNPYVLVCSEVNRGTGTTTYEERWNGAGPMSGGGTSANPFLCSAAGGTLRSVYLSPASVGLVSGVSTTTSSSGLTFYPNRVIAAGSGLVTFLSVHGPTAPATTPLVMGAPLVVGGTLSFGSRADRVLIATGPSAAADVDVTSSGRMAFVRRDSGAISAYALGEGTSLTFAGTQLVQSNQPVNVAYQGGRIGVSRIGPAASNGALPSIRLWMPAGVTPIEATVDEVPVPFCVLGSFLWIGTPSSSSGPAPSHDRFYPFTGGQILDGVLSPNLWVTADGRLTIVSSWGTFGVHGGASYSSGPLYIGSDFEVPLSNHHPILGFRWRLEGATTELGSVRLQRAGGAWILSVLAPSFTPITMPLSGLTGTMARLGFTFDPRIGALVVQTRQGDVLGSAAFPATQSPIVIEFLLSGGTFLDHIAVYDAVEDGVTPQGAVAWLLPGGTFGCAFEAPNLTSAAGYSLSVNGAPIAMSTLAWWLPAAGFEELILAGTIPTALQIPSIRELAFESAPGAVPPVSGAIFGASFSTSNGLTLSGSTWIGP